MQVLPQRIKSPNQLTWAYSNLLPFEIRTITFTMNVLPAPTNNINDSLNFTADISLSEDLNLSDNTFNLNQYTFWLMTPMTKPA